MENAFLLVLLIPVLFFVNIYLLVALVFALGKHNLFFTIVEEGQAKGIMRFGRAYRCVMSLSGYCFRGEAQGDLSEDEERILPENEDYWEIVERHGDILRSSRVRELLHKIPGVDLGGLYWVGIPPFYRVYTYTFKWASQRGELPHGYKAEDGEVEYYQTRITRLDFVLVRQETYALEMRGVEDVNLIPVDMKIVWTGMVTNPFKALFRVQEWLETSANRLLAHLRREFAERTWKDFQKLHYETGSEEDRSESNLEDNLKTVLEEIKELYGFQNVGLEISGFKPPEEFAEASLAVRKAEADAEAAKHEAVAIGIRADAERGRIESVYAAAQSFEDGVAMKIVEDLSQGENTTIILPESIVQSFKSLVSK